MRTPVKFAVAVALTVGSIISIGIDRQSKGVEVVKAWADRLPAAQHALAGYMVIRNNTARDDRIVSASSAIAERVKFELASHDAEGTAFVAVDKLLVPGRTVTVLEPGGTYLYFSGLRRDVAAGEMIPVTLTFEKAGNVTVRIEVGPDQSSAADLSTGRAVADITFDRAGAAPVTAQ